MASLNGLYSQLIVNKLQIFRLSGTGVMHSHIYIYNTIFIYIYIYLYLRTHTYIYVYLHLYLFKYIPGKVQVLEFALIFGIFTDLALSMEKVTDDDFARSTNRSKILGYVGS